MLGFKAYEGLKKRFKQCENSQLTEEERKANWAAIGCGVDFPGRTAFGNPEYEDQECYFTADKIN